MKRLFILLLVLSSAVYATVTNQNVSVTFSCSGSTGPYPFTFPISDASALTVTQDGVVLLSSTYSVTPVNNNYANGGSVVLNTICNSPSVLVLSRSTPVTQTTVYTDNMPIPMKTFERSLDKLTEISIEQQKSFGSWACPGGKVSTGFSSNLPLCGTPAVASGTWESPGTIGSNTPNTGSFTILNGSIYNVKAYGAVGNGVADDTTAINTALTAAEAVGGVLFFPPGTYKIASTLTPTSRVKFYGAGIMSLNNGGSGTVYLKKSATFTGNGILFGTATQGSVVEGITVDATAGSTGDGIQIYGNSVTLRNVAVVNQAGNGITIGKATTGGNANSLNFDTVRSANNGGHGYYFKDFGHNANAGTYRNLVAQSNAGDGVRFETGATDNIFTGILCESNTGAGIHATSTAETNYFFSGDVNEGNIGGNYVADASGSGQFFIGTDTGGTISDAPAYPSQIWNRWFGLRSPWIGGVTTESNVVVKLLGVAGTERSVASYNNGGGDSSTWTTRWVMQMADTVAESGGNAGSNWNLIARTDTGTNIGTALAIVRSTMAATFGGSVKATGGLNANSAGIALAGAISGATTIGASGTATVGGISTSGTQTPGQAICWKTATTLGSCSSVVGAGGACTCN